VQVIDLSQGANCACCIPLQNPGSGQGLRQNNPIIVRQHLGRPGKNPQRLPNTFCVTNRRFFRLLEETCAAPPLKWTAWCSAMAMASTIFPARS
jgi:hypothetical protein